MAALTTLAVIGVGLAVAGTGYSIYSQQQAAKQQKKARRAQERQQQVQYRRSQIQAARQAQIAAGQQRAAAAGLGGLETSGVLGGRAAIGSGLGAGLGFASEMSGLSRDISMFSQRAANAMGRAQIGQSIAGLGQQMFAAGGGFGGGQSPTPATLPTSPISSQYTSVGYGSPLYT
jgi:acyl CoA:acetate/3-ketoacid CoA transferase alpha subunit